MFETIGSINSIVMDLAGLMLCLFHYVRKPRKEWVYAVLFLLASLLSNYYWGVYLLVMGDYPNVSSILAYFGWDISYFPLIALLVYMRGEEERTFFSPLALLPIPLNIYQFTLYLPYGGLFNNIVQVGSVTVIACLSINAVCYYWKNMEKEGKAPYVPLILLFFSITEFTSWTASCFEWSSELADPYIYASNLSSLCYILLPIAIANYYGDRWKDPDYKPVTFLGKIFRPLFFTFIAFSCAGGYLLAAWMRDTISAGIDQVGEVDPYSVIAVMLFVVSIVIVLFSVMVILVVGFARKNEENEVFKEAKSNAERSNAAKSDFLANMSHEIRTPINAVLGMNEMILKEALRARDLLPEERKKVRKIFADICSYSGNIDSAGKNLLSIINDILDFSKIEAGKMELVDGKYKLSAVLNDVNNMISFKAKAKDLKFTVDADEDLPEDLYGDEVRVRQIIVNLLNNAVKYTPVGSVKLTVRARERTGENLERIADLVFSVKDTGIGIREKDLNKLFGKFERMDLDKNSTVEGTGLGLAITRSLLEMMDGNVRVESVYGEGSTFTATIPQIITSNAKLGDFKKTAEAGFDTMEAEPEIFYAPGAHILVVDDTRMNLLVVKGLLKSTGIVIDTAESGVEAIDLAKRYPYDMILMDQRMPVMDGITAMKKIREDADSPNAKTVFICLTADAVMGAKERYIAAGFEDYLTKPIDSKSLADMVLKYLPKDKIRKEPKRIIDGEIDLSGEDEWKDQNEQGKEEEMTEENNNGTQEAAEAVNGADMAAALIDREAGLRFCGGKEAFYAMMLTEYLRDAETKAPTLQQHYEAQDWSNYEIVVHSLKSSSKTIGATELSEIAKNMEAAAKSGDADAIRKEHDGMMKMYETVRELIRKEIGEA